MTWWLWIIAGLATLILELFLPSGFFLSIIGVSGIITGLLVLAGALPFVWTQCIVCAVLAVVLVLTVRRQLMNHLRSHGNSVSTTLGQEVILASDIEPGQIGRGEMRGAGWQVKNIGESTLKEGQHCTVEKMQGLVLCVKK